MDYPEVFTYYDYRKYLKDIFEWNKKNKSFFSHRYIVQKAGYKSPVALKEVIDRKKNLTLTSAEKFATAFKLTDNVKEYFILLYKFNTAETLSEKDAFFNEMTLLQKRMSYKIIEEENFDILDKWWTLVLREVISLPDYKHSKKWLARNVLPEISIKDVETSLDILERAGLIQKENGIWKSCDSIIKTEKHKESIKIAHYHDQMIKLALKALWELPSGAKEISGTVIRISADKFDEIKKRIYELRQSILKMAEESKGADQVYQLNVQLFPLVKTDRGGKCMKGRKQ